MKKKIMRATVMVILTGMLTIGYYLQIGSNGVTQ
jgi:hypothetical protein